ncbi:MAG TPA: hypothetical protein VKA73_08140 [Rubrobacter sp.]|nr:hypothetical protein [Rubrobacter sp.]
MRAIARHLQALLADPGSALSVILGVLAGALLGGLYESRPPTSTVPARGSGSHPGDRDG